MFIKELRIRNFRSIIKTDIRLNNISVFVGFNDVGKSNVLKTLNLFFNGETDYEKPLVFNEDYSKYAPIRKKKAEEITIELIINAPKTYKDSKDIKWTKVWRSSGLFIDNVIFTDGKSFPKKSKLNSWLKNIRFTYIPAIRGTSYFQILLANLHDTLAETIEVELRTAGDDFIGKIKSNTEEMTKEIFKRMEIKSQIRFPSNLQALFRTLDFATAEGAFDISLSNRGDGIKTRYIPAILKFISDQLNINKVKGSPNVTMIWGYEEPENNLEMLAAFKLGEQLIDYSNEIQLLISTHSPGIYSLKSNHPGSVNLFKVIKPTQSEAQILFLDSSGTLDNDMGIMPIISPYIEQKVKEVEELKNNIQLYKQELENINKNILFVEGNDEVRIFSKIITKFELSDRLIVKCEGLGCSGVKNQLMAWSWVSGISSFKAMGIFDNDNSGNIEYRKLKEEKQFKDSSTNLKVKGLIYKIPEHLRNIRQKINSFPIELEEMYPHNVWRIAEKKDWLVDREIDELNSFVRLDSANQTILEKINSFNFDEEEMLYVLKKIPDQHKDKISKYLIRDSTRNPIEQNLNTLIAFCNIEIFPFINS